MQIITDSDNNVLNFLCNPGNLGKVIQNPDGTFEHLRMLQKFTDDVAVNKYGHKRAGGAGDVKIIARMPQGLIIKLLQIEPDLLRDRETFNRIIRKYPIFAAYTRSSQGGAA